MMVARAREGHAKAVSPREVGPPSYRGAACHSLVDESAGTASELGPTLPPQAFGGFNNSMSNMEH
jgi:hypothetical protein